MTVRELIKRLEMLDQDADVYYDVELDSVILSVNDVEVPCVDNGMLVILK